MTNNRGRTEAENIARRYTEKRGLTSQATDPSAADGPAPDWRNRARATSLARRYAKIKRAAESRRPAEPEPEVERRQGLGHSTQLEHSSPEQLDRSSRETTRVNYSSTEELDETYHPQHSSLQRRAKPKAFSRDREEIARGKRPVSSGGEKSGDGSAGVEAEEGKSCEGTEPKLMAKEMSAVFLSRGFVGTHYPHRPTMRELGIEEDVECLFALAGLTRFMRNNSPAYQVETCHFLATLQVHLFDDHPEYVLDGGLGWITFKVRGQLYSLIEKVFDEEVLDEEVLDEEVFDEEVLDEEVLDEEVLDEEVLDEEVLDEEVFDEEVLDEEVLDEEVLDEVEVVLDEGDENLGFRNFAKNSKITKNAKNTKIRGFFENFF